MAKQASKKDRAMMLLNSIAKWQREGLSAEDAIGKLSMKQYDFLIDYGINLDENLLSENQLKVVKDVKKSPRPVFPEGYSKKYPAEKKELYGRLVEFVKEEGGVITPKEKENYREIDFVIENTAYRLVLSQPRVKKE